MAQSKSTASKNGTVLKKIAQSYDPWPLGTDAMIRILAWPDYRQPTQIQKVLQAASRLFGHEDACLCLRHDTSVDPPISEVIEAINAQLQLRPEVIEHHQEINILIIDDQIPRSEWYRVGLTAFCTVITENAPEDIRAQFTNAQRCEKIHV